MKEFHLDNRIFVDIKDLKMEYKELFQGIRSYTQFLTNKKIKNFVYGQIVDDTLVVTEKYAKKTGSIFIDKEEIRGLVESGIESSLGGMAVLPESTPPIILGHAILFQDDKGNDYKVVIRGKHIREEIFFKVKDVMIVFDLKNLITELIQPDSDYKLSEHYVSFVVPRSKFPLLKKRELYLTYQGIRKVLDVEDRRLGIARQFRTWIDELVPPIPNAISNASASNTASNVAGTVTISREAITKMTNLDADHLKTIMSKSASQISCLYLINVRIADGTRRVFKYGFTDNIKRRFKEHMRRYGDYISLDTFTLIPLLDLSKAETEFKNSISRYRYLKDGDDELISLCDEGYQNIKAIFRLISNQYCGNMQHQLLLYDGLIKDQKHTFELSIKDKDFQLMELRNQVELVKKDNEILRLQK
jgi:hypothetical protein